MYVGSNGEAVVSKVDRAMFHGTPPSIVIGHFIADLWFGNAFEKAVKAPRSAAQVNLNLAIFSRSQFNWKCVLEAPPLACDQPSSPYIYEFSLDSWS